MSEFSPENLRMLRRLTVTNEFQDWLADYQEAARIRQVGRKALIDSVQKICGVYRLKAFDQKPWYVGETAENLRIRLNRHNTRSDLIAGRIFQPSEWGSVDLWYIKNKADMMVLESALYWEDGNFLNPKTPQQCSDDYALQPPDLTLNFVEQFDVEDHYKAFLYHTVELGECIMTTRDDEAWHRAFKLRFDYLIQNKVI